MRPSPLLGTLPGQITDDTEMALALARTLLGAKGVFPAAEVAAAYVAWMHSDPFDIGGTTAASLREVEATFAYGYHLPALFQSQRIMAASEANGAMMRQSPLALWLHALPPSALLVRDVVTQDTNITHPNAVCIAASVAYVAALLALLQGGTPAAAHAAALQSQVGNDYPPTVRRTLHAAEGTPPPRYYPQEGHVLIALHNAFYQLLHAPSFEEGVVATIMGGGDTDTNAAIAAALLGAYYGVAAIPAPWRQAVLTCQPLPTNPLAARPRPAFYHTADILTLAERVLESGPATH